MAINLRVEATVVSIKADRPQATDVFLVDTQVWYWLAYTRASTTPAYPPLPYQTNDYPTYLVAARTAGARLCWCGLTLAELAHQIEKCERDIAIGTGGVPPGIPPKEYRHNYPALRNGVVSEISAAWSVVTGMAQPLDLQVDQTATNSALQQFGQTAIDGYDLFLLQAAAKAGITQILTDDSDYATVPGIMVFTSNRTIVNAAATQGKLLRR